jgi:1-acyl-sn-glycerol-3-phosphate acyltransferase
LQRVLDWARQPLPLNASSWVPVDHAGGDAGNGDMQRQPGCLHVRLRGAAAAVEAGECVVVFPEGTLTREPDMWPMAGKTGVARLALATHAPVVPIAQWGAHRLLARYGKLPRPIPRKTVTVVAGPPVDLADLYDRPQDAATLREATERVMDAITGLLEEIRGERAPAERFVWRRGEDRR